MNETLEDWQLALLVEARRKDDPTVVEANEAEDLRDAQELLEQADGVDNPVVVEHETKQQVDEAEALLDAAKGIDDWEVVDADQREAEIEACSAVEDALSAPLKEQNGLRDPVVEAMGVTDMVEQFRADDSEEGEIKLESLSQQPETGGDPEEPTDDPVDDGPDVDSLSASERNEVREKVEKADRMESRTPEFAETLRQEASEIAGVESVDDIDFEVL